MKKRRDKKDKKDKKAKKDKKDRKDKNNRKDKKKRWEEALNEVKALLDSLIREINWFLNLLIIIIQY